MRPGESHFRHCWSGNEPAQLLHATNLVDLNGIALRAGVEVKLVGTFDLSVSFSP
jgi:hypothetical protein